jgi:hypothetical protein
MVGPDGRYTPDERRQIAPACSSDHKPTRRALRKAAELSPRIHWCEGREERWTPRGRLLPSRGAGARFQAGENESKSTGGSRAGAVQGPTPMHCRTARHGPPPFSIACTASGLWPKEPIPEVAGRCPSGATHGSTYCRTSPSHGSNRGASRGANRPTTEHPLLPCRYIRTACHGHEGYNEKEPKNSFREVYPLYDVDVQACRPQLTNFPGTSP